MASKVRPHPKVGVVAASLSAGKVEHLMLTSWLDMNQYDVLGSKGNNGCGHLVHGGTINLLSGPRVTEGRSQIIEAFLKTPVSNQWLLMIDSDMVFEPDVLCELLGHAYGGRINEDPNNPDLYIIGGLCFAGGRSRMFPTIYEGGQRDTDDGGQQVVPFPVEDYPRNKLVKVLATGAAFLLVHRQVLVHMCQPSPKGYGTDSNGVANPYPWFVEGTAKGVQFGEDIAFCMRANALGYGVYVHTGVKIGHLKTIELNEEVWDEYLLRNRKPKGES